MKLLYTVLLLNIFVCSINVIQAAHHASSLPTHASMQHYKGAAFNGLSQQTLEKTPEQRVNEFIKRRAEQERQEMKARQRFEDSKKQKN